MDIQHHFLWSGNRNTLGSPLLTTVLLFILFLSFNLPAIAQDSPVLLSPAEAAEEGELPEGWHRSYGDADIRFTSQSSPRSDHIMLGISSDSLTRSRLFRYVALEPKSEYRLSLWVKTEDVTGNRARAGAGVSLEGFDGATNVTLTGTTDGWEKREITFATDDDDSMVLALFMGNRGGVSGTVWFDEIYLDLVHKTPLNPSVTIHMSERGEQMSDYIYGQFIEHMGNSIYGGIWAEMLEDRKFFYKPGREESPWRSTGDGASVFVDSLDSFVGNYTPVIRANGSNGLEQTDLWLAQGADYEGRIVMSGSASVLPVEVTLSWGKESGQKQVVTIDKITGSFESYPLAFTAGAATETATLTITPGGSSGTLKVGTLSLMPSNNIEGFRPEVLELMKQLNSPVYRWPGGNFVSGYDWKDGIGPQDKRPPRLEEAWANDYMRRGNPWNAVEPNDVGIHEFMRLCELLETEPFVALNTGLGSVENAAAEVEYINGSTNTEMGQWRAENSHPEPFDVTFFAVGNEMYGDWQLGHMPLSEYVKKHNSVAKAIWEVDPDAKLVAVGFSGVWNKQMYLNSADYMDLISEHFYRQNWHGRGLMTHVMQIPDAIKDKADEHRRWRSELDVLNGKDIDIAMDEWNFWYGPHIYGLLGTRYFLRDALGIAAGLNEYSRQSDIIYMANYAQTVNVIGAIKANPRKAFMAATGEVLKTYRREFGYIPVKVSGEKLPFDIAATLTKDGEYLTLSVVNPTEEDRELELDITGGTVNPNGTLYYITGKNSMVYNTVDNTEVITQARSAQIRDGKLVVPSISACIFKFPLQD